MTKQD